MKSECLEIKNCNSLINNVILFFLLLFFLQSNMFAQNAANTKNALNVIERLIGNRAKEFDLNII